MEKPVIAIVGRPNTGKSTLFNAIVGKRISITDDEPGVTRDRVMADAEWYGRLFTLIDTGGIDPHSKDSLQNLMNLQAEVAINMADVIIYTADLNAGVSDIDHIIAAKLRKSGKPVVLAVNKVDHAGETPLEFYNFYELGFAEMYAISSTHKLGLSELMDACISSFPINFTESKDQSFISVAILGKPNAGKSSLTNALLGSERSIVSDIPGTTRDAVDSFLENEFGKFCLIDTAGLRKKSRIDSTVEFVSALRSRRAVDRCDVALLLIDAKEGPTEQDTKVAGLAHNAGKASIFVVNKWDLMPHTTTAMQSYELSLRKKFPFMQYAPVIFLSALHKQRLEQVLPLVKQVYEASHRHISTSLLNSVIADAVVMHPTPQNKGKHLKIYYAAMSGEAPPNIVFFVNDVKLAHFSYERYLENRIRENFDFTGTPLVIKWKGKAARDEAKSVVTPE